MFRASQEAMGLSLEPASTMPLQQSLDSVTFLSELEENLMLLRYQEFQFVDETCSQSTKVAVARDISPGVIYQASLSLSSLCTVKVPIQALPNVAILELLALRSEQGVSGTQDPYSVVPDLLFGDGEGGNFIDQHLYSTCSIPLGCLESTSYSSFDVHRSIPFPYI